jgi:hypothetical protein
MPRYTTAVIPSPNEDFPFIAVVTDETGAMVSEVPVRTWADGEAMLVEALKELHEQDRKDGKSA